VIPEAEIFRLTSDNRLRIAAVLEELDDTAWESPTLCPGWTVHHMAAHLVQPMLVGFGRFFLVSMRFRGDTARTVDHFTRRLARRSRDELVALLRRHAGDRLDPPRVGPMGPYADTCVHLRDIARPLGLDADVPVTQWQILLNYLTGGDGRVAPGLVQPGLLDGLRFAATDTEWTGGRGALLTGPAEALGMAITGRAVALADLRGPGVEVLGRRLQPR
jgi:uncharacterized protein (TIGR03083 family)